MITLKIGLLLALGIAMGRAKEVKKNIDAEAKTDTLGLDAREPEDEDQNTELVDSAVGMGGGAFRYGRAEADTLEVEPREPEMDEDQDTELVDSAMDMGGREFRYGREKSESEDRKMEEDKAEVPKPFDKTEEMERNIDLEAAKEDGLTLEEFDALELEARQMQGKVEQDPDLFEGDILPSPRSRNANRRKNTWRKNTLIFDYDRSIPRRDRKKVRNALVLLRKKVNARGKCLSIRRRRRSDRNYVLIRRGRGCSSQVGMSGGRQIMNLARGCMGVGVVQHEFLHALGFWHEQSRSDRDNYLKINFENVQAGKEHNFKKHRTNNLGFRYDPDSLMHYGAYDFSKNGKPTIVGRYQDLSRRIGQRRGVSVQDVKEIRKYYGCRP